MAKIERFSVVVPTRNDPRACVELLRRLSSDLSAAPLGLELQVVFLVNDTDPGLSAAFAAQLEAGAFDKLTAKIVLSDRNYPTVEESLRNNLLRNLDLLSEAFIIIGNSDRLELGALGRALGFMSANGLELLLVGVLNQEMWDGQPIRAMRTAPRHIHRKNFLSEENSIGADIVARTVLDYGPFDFFAYLGCQIYTKGFFKALCAVELPEPFYFMPLATLEAAARQPCKTGFFHELVATRIDHLNFSATSPEPPKSWWPAEDRVRRGLSPNVFMSVLSSSTALSPAAFETLARSQVVSVKRGEPGYIYWNFLRAVVEQLAAVLRQSSKDPSVRLSPGELRDALLFGERLEKADLSLPAGAHQAVCSWFKLFVLLAQSNDQAAIGQWLGSLQGTLTILDSRPNMDCWSVNRIS